MSSQKAVDIRLLGDKRLQAKLGKLVGPLQRKIVAKACMAAGQPVLEAARRMVPVKTGKLKGSLVLKKYSGKRGSFGADIATGTREELGIAPDDKFFYPAAVEFGHGNVPAHSFLRAGIDSQRGTAKAILKTEIASGIRNAVKT